MILAERSILPDVGYDVQQIAQHLDHTAWTAIAAVEAEIVRLARVRLAPRSTTAVGPCETVFGFALRGLEGALRYGRPSFGARDAAWAISAHNDRDDEAFAPPVDVVYEAVLDAIQQLVPSAELPARLATRSILDEAVAIAARGDGRVPASVAAPTPIPPLAFRGLADLPHVAYVVDRSLRYAYVNQAWEVFARENDGDACLASSVVGRSWIEAIGGPDRNHWLAVAEQILAGAVPSHREEIPCHSPTDCRFIVVTASPLRLSEDDLDVAGLVFVTYDVTDLWRAEAERLWLNQEGRRVRDVFLGTVAHDLRSPLTTIKGRAQLLRRRAEGGETPLPASFEDSLNAIEATADQMVDQIEELLDVAQVQAGQSAPLRSRPTDLVDLIQTVLAAHEGAQAGHRLRLVAPARAARRAVGRRPDPTHRREPGLERHQVQPGWRRGRSRGPDRARRRAHLGRLLGAGPRDRHPGLQTCRASSPASTAAATSTPRPAASGSGWRVSTRSCSSMAARST